VSNETTPAEAEKDISPWGKALAGVLLAGLTILALTLMIGYWPDRMPGPKSDCQTYVYRLFHVRLIDPCSIKKDTTIRDTVTEKNTVKGTDTIAVKVTITVKDTLTSSDVPCIDPCAGFRSDNKETGKKKTPAVATITLNDLLLILVALGGFLGNMIHVASSFTAFVGAKKFRRSWTLWYFVKPFTAAALSMTLYFAFRAGFLNYSNDAGNLNLYGIMTLAMLSGMFTEIATRKLKEIFETVFKPKDEGLPDKLDGSLKITDVSPAKVDKAQKNSFTLKGSHLDAKPLVITINDEAVIVTGTKADTITFDYTVSAAQQAATVFKLLVTDQANNTVFTKDLLT
jgi:hypothetical protein